MLEREAYNKTSVCALQKGVRAAQSQTSRTISSRRRWWPRTALEVEPLKIETWLATLFFNNCVNVRFPADMGGRFRI